MTTFRTIFHEEQLRPQRTLTNRRSWPPEQLPHNAETLMTNTKPPKPRGELSWLKRGGYSLQATLGWDDDYYQKIQVILTRFVTHHAAHQTQKYISAKVRRDLPKKPYSKQDQEKITLFCGEVRVLLLTGPSMMLNSRYFQVVGEFPVLDGYPEQWVIKAFIRGVLNNTSRSRRQLLEIGGVTITT